MKKFLLAAAAAMVCLVQAGAQNVEQLPSIDVRGKSEIKVAPDELLLTIVVDEKDYKGKYTLEQKQEELLGVLKRHGVDIEENLKVGYMGSNMKIGVLRSQLKSLASVTYVLQLGSVDQMQKVIESLGRKGISNITFTKASYSQKDELEMQLAVEAVKDARKRAEVLSEALGQELGTALQVYVRPMWSDDPSPRYRSVMFLSKNAVAEDAVVENESAAAPVISVTELTFSVEVTAKFELKRK